MFLDGHQAVPPWGMFLAFYTLFTGVLQLFYGNFYGAFMTGRPRYAMLAPGPGVRPLPHRWQGTATWRVTLGTCARPAGARGVDLAT